MCTLEALSGSNNGLIGGASNPKDARQDCERRHALLELKGAITEGRDVTAGVRQRALRVSLRNDLITREMMCKRHHPIASQEPGRVV